MFVDVMKNVLINALFYVKLLKHAKKLKFNYNIICVLKFLIQIFSNYIFKILNQLNNKHIYPNLLVIVFFIYQDSDVQDRNETGVIKI